MIPRYTGDLSAGRVRDVILRDGATLRLRAPTLADESEIRAFFEGLDPDSRYLRFHGFSRVEAVARAYAEADGETRVALLAEHAPGIVAVAGYERLRDPLAAEVAFAVSRPYQRRGVGMRMLEQLAGHAAAHGLERFEAEVLIENREMLRVFDAAGFEVQRERSGGEVSLVLDIRPTDQLADHIARRDHAASVASLRALLAPRSVAVVGASAEPTSIGGRILRKIIDGGFAGAVWPINSSGEQVSSIPAVRALAELTQPPELVVIATPTAEVIPVVDEAGRVGVRAVLVVSGGFADAGDAGAQREAELVEVVRAWGMRMVGPDSVGLANTAPQVRLHATLGHAKPAPGGLAISSQPGPLGLGLLGLAKTHGLGIASFVATGNRTDVSPNDLLEYWEDDEAVTTILLYVESFGDPWRFAQIAQRVSRRKPILAIKGRVECSRSRETGCYTAASLESDAVFDALFRSCAVLRLTRTDELFDLAATLERQPLPQGRNVGVVTNTGELGTLAADAAFSRGLSVPPLADVTRVELARVLPRATRLVNPVDLTVDSRGIDFARAVAAVHRDPTIDAVVALYLPVMSDDAHAVRVAVEHAAAGAGKPTLASVLDCEGQPPMPLQADLVPNLRTPEECIAALAHAADRRDWLSRPLGQPPSLDGVDARRARELVSEVLLRDGDAWLDLRAAWGLLQAYGIPTAPTQYCRNPECAVTAAARLNAPIVLKATFPAPAHEANMDAVLLGLSGEDAIRGGWYELRRRVQTAARRWRADLRWPGEVIVQPLVDGGADVLIGSVTDPDVGALIGLGLSGHQAALTQSVAFRLPARTDTDADELINAAPGVSAWLDGDDSSPPLDRLGLRDLVLRFSRLLTDIPELAEADLTPVRVMPVGCCVLDARLRITPRTPAHRTRTW